MPDYFSSYRQGARLLEGARLFETLRYTPPVHPLISLLFSHSMPLKQITMNIMPKFLKIHYGIGKKTIIQPGFWQNNLPHPVHPLISLLFFTLIDTQAK